jgi:hypothetical protein
MYLIRWQPITNQPIIVSPAIIDLVHSLNDDFLLLLPLLRQHPLSPSDESAGECETQVPRDHSLEKEVRARFQQIQQVLVLEGKVVQVVQQVID